MAEWLMALGLPDESSGVSQSGSWTSPYRNGSLTHVIAKDGRVTMALPLADESFPVCFGQLHCQPGRLGKDS
jgi:hypothetical protein